MTPEQVRLAFGISLSTQRNWRRGFWWVSKSERRYYFDDHSSLPYKRELARRENGVWVRESVTYNEDDVRNWYNRVQEKIANHKRDNKTGRYIK